MSHHDHDHGHHEVLPVKLDFTLSNGMRTLLIGMIILGLVCMGITFFVPGVDDELHTRFWSNLLHNSVFFTGIAFISLFVICAFITAYAGWYTVMKRIWEAYSQFLLVGIVLMGIIAIATMFHWHHLYHWTDTSLLDPNVPEKLDRIMYGKKGFLNPTVYLVGTFLVLGMWYFFAVKIRGISVSEDRNGAINDFDHHDSVRRWAAAFLPIAAFSSAFLIWQWIMSVDAHWYSTMFAWYATASWFVSALCLTMLTLIYLKGQGYYTHVTDEHLHDIGKFIFAFSVFWTYLWFSQYMLIWYSNNGEETIYFHERRENYTVMFFANLILNFALPFLILMRNSTKRKYGTLVFTSVIVLFGHWLDFFQMIKPGVRHTAHEALGHADDHGHGDHGHAAADHAAHGGDHAHGAAEHAHDAAHAVAGHAEHGLDFMMGFTIPGLLEIGTGLGFLGLFMLVFFNHLSKAKLEPQNDPYYEESLHHHV